jgi:hypothetical protein
LQKKDYPKTRSRKSFTSCAKEMLINLTYIFVIVVGLYLAIVSYFKKRDAMTVGVMVVLVGSFVLEVSWMQEGSYVLETNDILRTTRDILWTIVTVWLIKGSILKRTGGK